MVHEKAGVLQRTPFDTSSQEQVAQLEALWSALQPSVRRAAGGWGDIGFQNGERPETDFRGMGLLGKACDFLTREAGKIILPVRAHSVQLV